MRFVIIGLWFLHSWLDPLASDTPPRIVLEGLPSNQYTFPERPLRHPGFQESELGDEFNSLAIEVDDSAGEEEDSIPPIRRDHLEINPSIDTDLFSRLRMLRNASYFINGTPYRLAFEWFDKKALAPDREKVTIPLYLHSTLKSYRLMNEEGLIPEGYLNAWKQSKTLPA